MVLEKQRDGKISQKPKTPKRQSTNSGMRKRKKKLEVLDCELYRKEKKNQNTILMPSNLI